MSTNECHHCFLKIRNWGVPTSQTTNRRLISSSRLYMYICKCTYCIVQGDSGATPVKDMPAGTTWQGQHPVMPHRILWLSTLEGFGIPLKVEKSKSHISHQISAKTVPIDSLCCADETNTKNDVIRSIMKEIR